MTKHVTSPLFYFGFQIAVSQFHWNNNLQVGIRYISPRKALYTLKQIHFSDVQWSHPTDLGDKQDVMAFSLIGLRFNLFSLQETSLLLPLSSFILFDKKSRIILQVLRRVSVRTSLSIWNILTHLELRIWDYFSPTMKNGSFMMEKWGHTFKRTLILHNVWRK